jgi:pyridoxamine 5'-phosphate oxidase
MTLDNKTLESLRVAYKMAELDIKDTDSDPLVQFEKWFHEAMKSSCDEPNAFTLSTISNNRPHSRVVLLKGFHQGGLVFYTNYLSHKGDEVSANPFGAINFLWLPLQRQVRVEGKLEKVEAKLSDDYFQKRPRGSQLGAIASPQSKMVKDRSELENLFKETEEKLKNIDPLPRPSHWGGYKLIPDYYEFWQGRDNRMHDRITYRLQDGHWLRERLAP